MTKQLNFLNILGLEVLVYLGADANDQLPTEQYCQQYAAQFGFPPERMIIDYQFAELFAHVDSGDNNGTTLPWDAILDGHGMVYKWNGTRSYSGAYGEVMKLIND